MLAANDFITALARLLANPALRKTFRSNPRKAADLLNLTGADKSMFVALSATQLERQARLLINKRMREVFTVLPLTVQGLGANAAAYFSDYAAEFWPDSHRRHTVDAWNFCNYLRDRQLPFNQSERNRVWFHHKRARIGVYFTKDRFINGKARYAVQVFYRHKDRQGEWRVYLKA